MPQLTVAELETHPEYAHVIWPLPPQRKGLLPVAAGRGGPFNIAWELHGRGPKHVVFVMGLGGLKNSWQRSTKDLAHTKGDEYSVLILDNRGIGDSETPRMRYSTSEMARDTIEVLDHVGWREERSVTVVGISMGGMIAQEMCLLIPTRLNAVVFTSTAARLVNTIGFFENLANRARMLLPHTLDDQIMHAKNSIYSPGYIYTPDDTEYTTEPFPTCGDRFGAAELRKRRGGQFTRLGFLLQAIAAGWHHKSKEQMREIADKVGRERLCIVHGTLDRMITVPHAHVLSAELSGDGVSVRTEIFEGQAHIIPVEKRGEYLKIVEETVEAGLKATRDGR